MTKKIELEHLDREDYILITAAFKYLSHRYGPFLVDMFANANNTKCVSFVGRHADIGSIPETIDAFYQPSWGSAFYAFPPVDDAPRALIHVLSQTSVRGVLILPLCLGAALKFLYSIPRWETLHPTDPAGLVSPVKYRLQ